MKNFLFPLVGAVALSGCATIMEGTTQSITIATTPPGAHCTVDREGARVGEIGVTPGSIQLNKSGKDLSVTCSKAGFQTATIAQSPDFSGTTFGNIIIGGGIGAIADAASGANYKYPAQINVALAPGVMPTPVQPLASNPAQLRRRRISASLGARMPITCGPQQRQVLPKSNTVRRLCIKIFVAFPGYGAYRV
jgi:hypothetical protein